MRIQEGHVSTIDSNHVEDDPIFELGAHQQWELQALWDEMFREEGPLPMELPSRPAAYFIGAPKESIHFPFKVPSQQSEKTSSNKTSGFPHWEERLKRGNCRDSTLASSRWCPIRPTPSNHTAP